MTKYYLYYITTSYDGLEFVDYQTIQEHDGESAEKRIKWMVKHNYFIHGDSEEVVIEWKRKEISKTEYLTLVKYRMSKLDEFIEWAVRVQADSKRKEGLYSGEIQDMQKGYTQGIKHIVDALKICSQQIADDLINIGYEDGYTDCEAVNNNKLIPEDDTK